MNVNIKKIKEIDTKKIRQVLAKPLFHTAESMVGLDIGSRFLKFVEIEETAGGYKLKKIGIKQLPLDVIVDEEIMDTDTLVNIITSFLQEFKIETKSVALIVSGRDVLVKTVETELKGKELLKKKEEVARANIPYDIEDVCFDVMSLKGSSNKVLVAAAKNDKIYSTLKIVQE
ncbi:MAG: pilus assembly protein PilM, partial [bacterium]|nr:pilus assembly protein PilM [bacterium]